MAVGEVLGAFGIELLPDFVVHVVVVVGKTLLDVLRRLTKVKQKVSKATFGLPEDGDLGISQSITQPTVDTFLWQILSFEFPPKKMGWPGTKNID